MDPTYPTGLAPKGREHSECNLEALRGPSCQAGVVGHSPVGHPPPEVAAMADTYNSGERAPYSGQIEIVGPRGGRTGEERTVVQGEPLPPTPESGQRFVYVDRTRNGAGRSKGRK